MQEQGQKLFINEDFRTIELHSEIDESISAEFCSFIRNCNEYDKAVKEAKELAIVRELGEIEEDGEVVTAMLDKTVYGENYKPKPITIYLSTVGGHAQKGLQYATLLDCLERLLKLLRLEKFAVWEFLYY